MEERFIELLESTKIEGINKLIKAMKDGGFFTAPCSTKYHLCREGGLLEHSLNVYTILDLLNTSLNAGLEQNDVIICSLLHDLGKMGEFDKPNYVKAPLLKSGKEPAEPYKTNPDLIYEEHENRSVDIALRYIDLTEEQVHAIRHHNGLWGKLDSSYSSTFDKHKLSFLLHTADTYCSRFIEAGGNAE